MNALGESTLVTDYIPRSRRQRGGTGAKGAADRDRNPPIDREPTFALTTDGRRIPAIVGDLDATANDGGDEVHERGYSRLKRSGVLESGGEKAESSDVTDLHSLEQLTGPQQRCRGLREWSRWSEPWSILWIGCHSA